MVAANPTASAPLGTYQVAVLETLPGGHQAVVPLEVVVGPPAVGSMGMSMGD